MNLAPQPRTVLIVDDEDLFRTSVCDALGHACPHYEVMQAANGRQALECLDRRTADVVLTDLSMPVMGGVDLLLNLRERKFAGSVITVTAYGDPLLEQQVLKRGALSHLEKPVDLGHLISLLQETAEGHRDDIEGLTVQGFAQLIALERKTCRLRVSGGDEIGDLYFFDGELVQAHLGRLSGEPAAIQLLASANDVRLEVQTSTRVPARAIFSRFHDLLVEAERRRDETMWAPTPAPAGTALSSLEANDKTLVGHVDSRLREAMSIDGAIGISLVDFESGMTLGQAGGDGSLDIDIASAGNTAVVRAKLQVMKDLGLDDTIEDILISLGTQYHLIRPLSRIPNLFIYFALDRHRANLGMARLWLSIIEDGLTS